MKLVLKVCRALSCHATRKTIIIILVQPKSLSPEGLPATLIMNVANMFNISGILFGVIQRTSLSLMWISKVILLGEVVYCSTWHYINGGREGDRQEYLKNFANV